MTHLIFRQISAIAILIYSAQPLNGFNTPEQGSGELNVDGAVRLARLVKTTLPTANGGALLNASLPTHKAALSLERPFIGARA